MSNGHMKTPGDPKVDGNGLRFVGAFDKAVASAV